MRCVLVETVELGGVMMMITTTTMQDLEQKKQGRDSIETEALLLLSRDRRCGSTTHLVTCHLYRVAIVHTSWGE